MKSFNQHSVSAVTGSDPFLNPPQIPLPLLNCCKSANLTLIQLQGLVISTHGVVTFSPCGLCCISFLSFVQGFEQRLLSFCSYTSGSYSHTPLLHLARFGHHISITHIPKGLSVISASLCFHRVTSLTSRVRAWTAAKGAGATQRKAAGWVTDDDTSLHV